MDKQTKVVATRITQQFAQVLEEYCHKEAYINTADFIRTALREKLKHDAPEFYDNFLERCN
jgi:Arc/MetJ-type ribon-helix-helix transcriptional regulator